MRIALDTNVLAYAEGLNDAQRRDSVLDILARVPPDSIVVPVQVLGDCSTFSPANPAAPARTRATPF